MVVDQWILVHEYRYVKSGVVILVNISYLDSIVTVSRAVVEGMHAGRGLYSVY